MSFWDFESKEEVSGKFEMGGSIEPIPDKTQVLACIEDIKWDSYDGDEYISATWAVLAPADYKNRKVFQKLKVKDSDSKKRDKAIRMLAAIDINANGGLMKSGLEPTDESMKKALALKPMVLMLQVWEMNDKKGNWISSVSPRSNQTPEKVVPTVTETIPMSDEDEADLLF